MTGNETSITNIIPTMNDMEENIITLICNSCGCDKTEAQEYLDSELACSNLGLDLDYQEYFINRLAGA